LPAGSTPWTYLPGTFDEVTAIKELAREYNVRTSLFTGTEAREEQLKKIGAHANPSVLHIATHGFFFPDADKSFLNEDMSTRSGKLVFKTSDNPLDRSGLLFAGANHAWSGHASPEGTDDGILTAYEAASIYLGQTRLVVLSACETGLGDIKGSEGVFGLQRAFKSTGAEYLMMSLWQVPDKETSEFMTFFYTRLLRGFPIPDAFKYAQEQMKQKYYDEPYKWAAFVLVR
jgi:CHAT domain-containing protein